MSSPGMRSIRGSSCAEPNSIPINSIVTSIILPTGWRTVVSACDGQRGHGDVVEADDRQIAGNVEAELPARRIHEADGENIVGAEHAIRAARPAKQAGGGLVSPLIGKGASLDADRFLDFAVEASAPIALPPVDSGGGVRPARHEGEPPMTKLDQMIGDKPPAADIVAGHAECVDVQRAAG